MIDALEVREIIVDTSGLHPRYIVRGLTPEGEARAVVFPQGTMPGRDRLLETMREYLERDDAVPVQVRLAQVGRAILLVPDA